MVTAAMCLYEKCLNLHFDFFVSILYCFPPSGAPGPPGEPFITRYGSALTIHWTSGDPGRAPITRYVIEARPSGVCIRPVQMISVVTLALC